MSNGATVHAVMRSFRTLKMGENRIPRRQNFEVSRPLNGMVTPKDLPREFWKMQEVRFGACNGLAHPRNLEILQDAIEAFKHGRIVVEKGKRNPRLEAVTWNSVLFRLARAGKTNRVGFTFRLGDDLATYLDVDNGNGNTLSWRLFLGKL
ncbi:MAG: hypothetical protein ABH845_01715 [Candidatus Omnitrophota bacterium]